MKVYRCEFCGRFMSPKDIVPSASGKVFHYPSCFLFFLYKDNSLKGRIVKQIVQRSNFAIDGTLSIDVEILKKNVSTIIKMVQDE